DDVILPISVDIIDVNVRPAALAKLVLVLDPFGLRIARLLEPAIVDDDVEPAIAIDISYARAVVKLHNVALAADADKLPRLGRIGPVRPDPSPAAQPVRDQLWLAIAINIAELRRLAIDHLEDQMLLPH